MKKNPGRKERRRIVHQNKIGEAKKKMKLENNLQKMKARGGK